MNRGEDETAASGGAGSWYPWLWIILASAAAHLWCLGSQFYMDDYPQIRDNPAVLHGLFTRSLPNMWTTLWHILQYRLFGMSPVGFHALNWLIHTGVALVLFGFSREMLRGKWGGGVALFAALLFAVHPLGSEIPNYARAQDLAWVTLFSLLAGWFLLRYRREGGWVKLLACAVFFGCASISKGPGFLHAGFVCLAVALFFRETSLWEDLRKNWPWLGGGVILICCVIAALWSTEFLNPVHGALERLAEPRGIGHAYTLARVFWEFAWRAIIPVFLSSDHLITETLVPPGKGFWTIPDKVAMLAMAAEVALAVFALVLASRKSTRVVGTALFLFVATMLMRVTFVIPEFMPEYRIYPGLPWFCLGAAVVLTGVWSYLFETVSPRVPAVLLLAVFALMSARRSFVWHDLRGLTDSVLRQYPASARALWEINDRDLEAGNYQAIIDRHRDVWPGVERQFIAQNQQLAPAREIPSGHFVLSMVAMTGRYARALALQEKDPAKGLQVMEMLAFQMSRMGMTTENKHLEWGYFYHDKGLLYEMAGDYPAAAECLRKDFVPRFWWQDRQRVEKKLAEVRPGS